MDWLLFIEGGRTDLSFRNEQIAQCQSLMQWYATERRRSDTYWTLDELLSEMFVCVLEAIETFDPSRGATIRTWASRKCEYRLRILSRPTTEDRLPAAIAEPASRLHWDEMVEPLREDERDLLSMTYREGRTREEIASRLMCCVSTVSSRHNDAIERLRSFQ